MSIDVYAGTALGYESGEGMGAYGSFEDGQEAGMYGFGSDFVSYLAAHNGDSEKIFEGYKVPENVEDQERYLLELESVLPVIERPRFHEEIRGTDASWLKRDPRIDIRYN